MELQGNPPFKSTHLTLERIRVYSPYPMPNSPESHAILAPNATGGHSRASDLDSKTIPVIRYNSSGQPKQLVEAKVGLAELGKPKPIAAILEEHGLGRAIILSKLARQLDANDMVLAQWNGEFTDIAEVPANPSRNKAIELACKLHGLIDGKPDVNVGVSISINWDSAMPAWTKPPIEIQSASDSVSVSADTPPTSILSQIEGTGIGPRRMNSHPLGQLDQSQTPTAHPLGQSGESQTPSTLSERVEKPRLRSGPRLPVNGKKYGARWRRG